MDLFAAFDEFRQIEPLTVDPSGRLLVGTNVGLLEGAEITVRIGDELLASGRVGDSRHQFTPESGADEKRGVLSIKLERWMLAKLLTMAPEAFIWVRSSGSLFPLAAARRSELQDGSGYAGLLEVARGRIEHTQWSVDAVFKHGGKIYIVGWALSREGDATLPEIYVDDVACAQVFPAGSFAAADLYWFLPNPNQLGFVAIGESDVSGRFIKVDARFPQDERSLDRRRFSSYNYMGDAAQLAAMPPEENIHRVSGPASNRTSYLNGGFTDFHKFRWMIDVYGAAPSLKGLRVLDWGCGCGRLARHFIEAGAQVVGIDIDADNAAWCQTAFPEHEFRCVDLMPPTELAADSFDVIISSSVLSHLTEPVMNAWLAEMHRVLKPGGVALLSYNGDGTSFVYGSQTPEALIDLTNDGFFDKWRTPDLDDVLKGEKEYYRLTLMTDARAAKIFEQIFQLEAVVKATVSGHQNVAVLKK